MNKWVEDSGLYALIALLGFWVMFFSIWDILFYKQWLVSIVTAYVILFLLLFIVLFYRHQMPVKTKKELVEEFEKKLKGSLHHFKCPNCMGFFAIKKSKSNDEKPVQMTCPGCGAIGILNPDSVCIEAELPERKSIGLNLQCKHCGEGVTVWAEGSEMHPTVSILTCPYCGEDKPLSKI